MNIVRFVHNWNDGILEYWNYGFWENGMVDIENQDEYNRIDFLVIVAYFLSKNRKWRSDEGIIIKCRYNIFCKIDLFPLFRSSLPWPRPITLSLVSKTLLHECY